jgi:ribosomal protein L40E
MKGPLHAIRRRRSERQADGVDTAQAATEAPTQAHPPAGLASASPPPASDQGPATAELGATAPAETAEQAQDTAGVPAGREPIPDRPSFRQRGRLRRRLRYLRRVRELGFRDLGGLVFDQHRFSQVNIALVEGKLAALGAVDAELRALEYALDDRRALTELREPGISVCSRCGALHGSDARFCPSCGTPVRGPRAIAEVGEAVSLSVGEIGAVTPPRPPSTPPPPAQPLTPTPLHTQPVAPMPGPVAPEAAAPASTEHRATAPEPATPEAGAAEPRAAAPEPTAPQAAATPASAEPREAAPESAQPEPAEPSEPEPASADHGEQPTEVMRPVDGQAADPAADGQAEAMAQPTGERRES